MQGISAGTHSSCGIDSSGSAKCWGYNASGQLGNNSLANSNVPVQVAGLTSGTRAIDVDQGFACAIDINSAVKCW